MAIAFVAAGAAATGSTSLSVAYPAGLSSGNLLLLAVSNKYPTNGPSAPSGFTLLNQSSGGAGSAAADSGDVYCTVFYRVSDGTETGNLSVTLTGSNSAVGRMFAYSNGTGSWDLASAVGADTTASTQYRITYGSDPGVDAGDLAFVASAMNGTGTTYGTNTITQTGVTFGAVSERQDSGTATGDNCLLVVTDASASSGTGSAAPQSGCNSSSSFGNYPAGAAVFVRLREAVGGGGGFQAAWARGCNQVIQ